MKDGNKKARKPERNRKETKRRKLCKKIRMKDRQIDTQAAR